MACCSSDSGHCNAAILTSVRATRLEAGVKIALVSAVGVYCGKRCVLRRERESETSPAIQYGQLGFNAL